MGRTRKSAGSVQPKEAAAKKARTSQQPGIAAAFAAAEQWAASESAPPPELCHNRPRDLLSAVLTQDLEKAGDQYLQHWGDKCFMARGEAAAAARAAASSSRVQRAAAVAAESKEDADLDVAALRYLEELRHVQQQAIRAEAAVKPRNLELLALILRCDVLHKHGDVSYQAYTALQSMLRCYPYASIGRYESGLWAGRLYVIVDERAAWQPLEAMTDPLSLTRRYMLEESIKDAGHNHRLDHHESSAQLLADRKKGGQLGSVLQLLKLCVDRAVDSVEEDHNGDVLLLAYLLALLQQDLRARLQVFEAYADVEDSKVLGLRFALLQNSLLWRVWMDQRESDKERADAVRLLMKLIVGVASEQELQEVEEQEAHAHRRDPDAEEQANPCICTPRQLAALAATLLNMLLDCFSAAEAAGGFVKTRDNRMHRSNLRLLMDKQLKQLFWKNKAEAVCLTDEQSRAFLEALAPAHRLRLLSLVAMEHVAKAYYLEEASRRPALLQAKQVEALVTDCDSGGHTGTFPVDPLVALRCLNLDKYRSIKVFTNVSGDSAVNNLAVLACGIALAAHALAASGAELPISGAGSSSSAGGEASGSGGAEASGSGDEAGGSGGEAGDGPEARRHLQQEAAEFLRFLADTHRQYCSGERKEKALWMSRASLLELLHAQAAITALA
ncbi:hypothetical protein C2E21_1506 [Chlorella sorokiniana]|uniref:Uncharacterized protein n=1 Tax=Chlorella sorokiniana TaxID=3076 RepID=A0A2P6U005_CHLSO|nr:hypothetical protein C2E21_1506 [Chlorella sorokiniana]|eukprot:PRW59638.1 hypothetical protein C2E21_1506 [Chlorella sorokiniana]